MKALSRAMMRAVAAWIVCVSLGAGLRAQEGASGSAAATDGAGKAETHAELEELQRTVAARPEWTEGWWKLGTMAYEADRFEIAGPALRKVVEAKPEMGVAWALLGLSEFETKGYSDALRDLERADTLGYAGDDEIQRVAVYHLALLLIRTGEFERASTLLGKTFGPGAGAQVSFAQGLAMLRVPLLPSEVDPSREALLSSAGALAAQADGGLAHFPAFLAANPGVPYAHYSYGRALASAGREREALAEMRAETVVSPHSPLPWQRIGELEQRLGHANEARAAQAKAVALSGTKQPEAEIAARYAMADAKTVASTGADGDAQWTLAMQAYASGQYGEARDALKPWLTQHAGDGTAWAVLGLSEFALHDERNALLHLERGEALGLRGSPESIKAARYTMGILLLEAGEFDRAAEVLARVAKVFPQDAKVRYALGLTLLRRAELPRDAPADAALVEGAGEIALLLGDSRYDEAFARFKALLGTNPGTPFLHYAFGTALMALSEFEEATAQMRAETAISPGSGLPYIRLASIALRQHRPEEAIAPATRALALAPDSADAHYLLGRACLETGDEAKAIRELEQASKLSPGSPEVHFNLARAYARARMTEAAATERATFARLNELSQGGKSEGGNQIYTGPRGDGSVTSSAPVTPAPQP